MTSGLSAGEVQALVAWPAGPRIFEHLRDIERPFQLADLTGYLESLGFPPGPWSTRTMQGAPMRHRGGHGGHFFVGDKADGEAFTEEDEEILALFASRAAAAIANARTHCEVEQARADLAAGRGGVRGRQRAGFLRMVSHELRAPLASIKGSARSVLEASPAASRAERPEFFRLINGQADHMRGLIANLQAASRRARSPWRSSPPAWPRSWTGPGPRS